MNPLGVLTTQLWEHQCNAMPFVDRGQAVLAMKMGTGKTATTFAAIDRVGSMRNLVLCPKIVMGVWRRQAEIHTNGGIRVLTAEGCKSVKAKAEILARQIMGMEKACVPYLVAINYEAYWWEAMFKVLCAVEWSAIIADESHRVKAHNSKQSSMLFQLAHNRTYGRAGKGLRLGLTGTFMPHSPMDPFGQMRFVNPRVFGLSFTSYRNEYAILNPHVENMIIGYKNLDKMQEKLTPYLYVVDSEDVLKLPDFTDTVISVPLEPATRKIYRQMEQEFIAEVKGGTITAANAMIKVLRLAQIASGIAKFHDPLTNEPTEKRVGSEKLKAVYDLISDMPSSEAVVIFTRFRAEAAGLRDILKGERVCATLDGDHDELEKFTSGEANTLICNIQSGKEGIDLTRARYVIYSSPGVSLGDYTQSRFRVRRPGQTRPVTYYHIVAEDTVEAECYKRFDRNEKIVEGILQSIKEGNYGA